MRGCLKILFVLSFVLISPSLAKGQSKDRVHRPPDFSKMPFVEDLNLNNEQKKLMKSLHEANRAEFKKFRETMVRAKSQLEEALDGNVSDDEVRILFQKLLTIRAEMMAFRFERALSIRKILTPEQRKKFKVLRRNRFNGKRRFRHCPMGPGAGNFPPKP